MSIPEPTGTEPDRFREPDEMRVKDARLAISTYVGRKQSHHSPLTKGTHNSVARYLTGSFAFPPKHLHSGKAPSIENLRMKTASMVDARGVDGLEDYFESGGSRPFRRDELRAIMVALKAAENKQT